MRLAAGRTQAEGRAAVRRHRGRVTGELHIFNGLAARLRARDAVRLQRDPAVAVVSLNAAVKPQSISTKDLRTAYPFASNAPPAWNNSSGGGSATGLGVGVAVIDTGIAGALPDFRVSTSDPSSRVIGSAVVNPLATTAEDTYGHGTHVAGILAGNGNTRAYGDPLRGQYVGIAPRANLVSVKVADDDGNATSWTSSTACSSPSTTRRTTTSASPTSRSSRPTRSRRRPTRSTPPPRRPGSPASPSSPPPATTAQLPMRCRARPATTRT